MARGGIDIIGSAGGGIPGGGRTGRFSIRLDPILIALLVAAFAIRIYIIDLPGPYGDEISFVLPAYQMKWGHPFAIESAGLLGHQIPLSVNSYTGALPVYAQFAFAQVTGKHWFGYRILDIAYAIATIAVVYAFAVDLFGRRIALPAAALFSFMPSAVFYSRLGEPVIFLRVLLSTMMLFFAYRWWRSNNWRYFYAGCLSLGLGMSTRVEIVWWIIAIVLYLRFANRSLLRAIVERMHRHRAQALTGLGLAILGAAFFLGYNITTPAQTLAYVVHNLLTTYDGHHNLAFVQNFQRRLTDLTILLNGSDRFFVAYFGPTFRNNVSPVLFLGCFLLLVARSVLQRVRGQPARRTEFLVATTLLILVMSTFTVTALAPYQLLIMMPLPLLVIAHALDAGRLRRVGSLLIVALLVGDLAVDVSYYRSLRQTEGVGLFSSSIFDLARDLRGGQGQTVVACDWRILQLLQFVSEDKIQGREIFGYESGPESTPPSFYQALEQTLQTPGSPYIFYAPRYEQFKRHQAFLNYLHSHGLAYQRDILYDRNGPIYYVYHVRRSPAPIDGAQIDVPRRPGPARLTRS